MLEVVSSAVSLTLPPNTPTFAADQELSSVVLNSEANGWPPVNGLPASRTGLLFVTSPPKASMALLPKPEFSDDQLGVPVAAETKTPAVLLAAYMSVFLLSKKKPMTLEGAEATVAQGGAPPL